MYESFERLLADRHVTIADVSRATGIGKSTFSGWKKGSYMPKADKIGRIAEYFNVPMDYFYDDSFMDYWEQVNGEWKWKNPVYQVAAGEGAYNDIPQRFTDLDANEGESWCEVHGDSMYPELKDGDMVKVKHQTETSPHDLTVIKLDGEHTTVKFVEIVENGVWLRAINKKVYEDHFFTVSEVMSLPITIVGKVIELRRSY